MANEGVNFSAMCYLPAMDIYAVEVWFNPLVSSPGADVYANRGIFTEHALNVLAENGSIYSDQQVILDIRDAEYTSVPMPRQGDHVTIPRDCNGDDRGEWVIVDSVGNGGGQTTFTLRKWEG